MKTKIKIALNMSRMPVSALINKSRFIVTCLTGNTNFPNPTPTLAVVTTAINDLEATWNAAADGGKVKTATMHDKQDALIAKMSALAIFVEFTANNDVSKVNSSGFDVKQSGTITASEFAAQLGKQSGDAVLKVKAKPRAIYHWQYSVDPVSATSWLDFAMNSKSRITISGLTPGAKYWFRVRYMDKDGAHPFTDAIYLIVV